jgi:hypothetical protein
MPTETTPGIDVEGERIRTIKDVGVLLEFLGQRADSRLQAHFEDTRGNLGAPIRKLAVPPCRTYRHFLNRLVGLTGHLPGLRVDATAAPVQPHSPPEGDEGLGDLPFLYFNRDFLAAVATPATVETICVTRAYKVARRYSLLSPLLHPRRPRGLGARTATSPDGGDECAASAKRLAFRVVAIEYGAIMDTVITLLISAYALSGHMILDSQRQILADHARSATKWRSSRRICRPHQDWSVILRFCWAPIAMERPQHSPRRSRRPDWSLNPTCPLAARVRTRQPITPTSRP